MTIWEMALRVLFWIAAFGLVWYAAYRYFKRQDERAPRQAARRRPAGARRGDPGDWEPATRQPVASARSGYAERPPAHDEQPWPEPRARQLPPERPAPAVDARRATELALAVLPAQVPYDHRVTLDAIPFFYSGQRWQTLSLRNAQAWGWGVFGATRSGKGNILQLVALSALSLGPEACEVWVLDPKTGLDYGFCLQLAHARLYADGIPADGGLSDGYEQAMREMQRRNALLQRAGARNIQEYHAAGNPPLPYLLLIADEVAQLDAGQRALLNRLASMAAASGIMLFVSTQYPTSDVLSSQVQINVQNRLVFRLSSARYAEVALGLARGERGQFDPSAIPGPGLAILRRQGQELVGRVPEIGDQLRQQLIDSLRLQWPRQTLAPASFPAPAAGAHDPLSASAPAETPLWSERHIKVAAWLAREPEISNREIARRLNPGSDGGGEAAVKAKLLRQQVEALLGAAVRPVRPVHPGPEEQLPAEDERRTALEDE